MPQSIKCPNIRTQRSKTGVPQRITLKPGVALVEIKVTALALAGALEIEIINTMEVLTRNLKKLARVVDPTNVKGIHVKIKTVFAPFVEKI